MYRQGTVKLILVWLQSPEMTWEDVSGLGKKDMRNRGAGELGDRKEIKEK